MIFNSTIAGSGSSVETAHVEYYPVGTCYFTDTNMTVQNNGGNPIDFDLPVGTIVVDTYQVFMPTGAPIGLTQVAEYAASKNGWILYQVTG